MMTQTSRAVRRSVLESGYGVHGEHRAVVVRDGGGRSEWSDVAGRAHLVGGDAGAVAALAGIASACGLGARGTLAAVASTVTVSEEVTEAAAAGARSRHGKAEDNAGD